MNLEKLTENLRKNIEKSQNTKVIFCDAIEKGNITVIPVAKYRLFGGTGSGGGRDEKNNSSAEGFGIGISSDTKPLGYIEIKNGEAKFIAINDKALLFKFFVVVSLLISFFVYRITRKK